jgi:DNA-binding response OmpR family regulator
VIRSSALGRCDKRVAGLDTGAYATPYEPAEFIAGLQLPRAHHGGRFLSFGRNELGTMKYEVENAGALVTREMLLLLHVWTLRFDHQTDIVDVDLARFRRAFEYGFATCLKKARRRAYQMLAA